MATHWRGKYVHKIAPHPSDTFVCELPDDCFSDRNKLAAALRKAGVFPPGTRLRKFRFEGDELVAFPMGLPWHSVILTCER